MCNRRKDLSATFSFAGANQLEGANSFSSDRTSLLRGVGDHGGYSVMLVTLVMPAFSRVPECVARDGPGCRLRRFRVAVEVETWASQASGEVQGEDGWEFAHAFSMPVPPLISVNF